MTSDEFIDAYCSRSGVTRELFLSLYVALPCACGEDICEGWAKVRNNPEDIAEHNQFYGTAKELHNI